MDVSAIAAAASANAAARVQAEASVRVLKMAMDMQAESALRLVEVLPSVIAMPSAPVASGNTGRIVDTWV